MVTFRVTRRFYSDINGEVGEEKCVTDRIYRALLATVQPDDPTGTPRYWEVVGSQVAPSESTVEPVAEPVAGDVADDPDGDDDLPGAPPPSPVHTTTHAAPEAPAAPAKNSITETRPKKDRK